MQISFQKTIHFFLACLCPLFGETMLDRIALLQNEDLVVYQFHQSVSIVIAEQREEMELHILTATKETATREGYKDWIEWAKDGAPGALGDERIQLLDGKISKITAASSERLSWFLTLLQLDLQPIPNERRKRAGPPPMPGEMDFRPLWQPKIIVHSEQIDTKSEAYVTKWPKDNTPISERPLVLYFPSSTKTVQALPYRIESPTSSYYVQVINSTHSP